MVDNVQQNTLGTFITDITGFIRETANEVAAGIVDIAEAGEVISTAGQPAPDTTRDVNQTVQRKDNTGMWILAGIGLILIMSKKKATGK